MRIAPGRRPITTRDYTAAIANDERAPLRERDSAGRATQVEDLAGRADDDADDRCVTGKFLQRWIGQHTAESELSSLGTLGIEQSVGRAKQEQAGSDLVSWSDRVSVK